ncbi:MAG: hypothetical protein AMS27_00775 [Bacteroides sp. SM23_62_1]|nr:MAG: hypothetical protein AMS27_00775 [Bacteroides sp. SM23_62_1]
MKVINLISRIIVGAVFVFSGFVKAVDPLGSTYKFSDYFSAFGMAFLNPVALPLAILLSSTEFLVGISLLFGYRYRLATWILVIFMSFFTVLTLILAITNPVSDCGCFGDAIILTNWETFFKNICLLPFAIFIFFYRTKITALYSALKEWLFVALYATIIVMLQFYSLRHLPPMDFRPYSIGTYIPDKMMIPEAAPLDEYKTYLYYEKDGRIEEFNEENYPWQDTTWKFVESKHVLVRKGYEPLIHDFTMYDDDGYDHIEAMLADKGYTFLLVSHNLAKADMSGLEKADLLATSAYNYNYSFYCLTASPKPEIDEISLSLGLQYPFLTSDEIALKTIIRSNPGLLLIKEGVIVNKWHYRDFPDPEELNTINLSQSLTRLRKDSERSTVFYFIAFLFLVALSIRVLFPDRSLE